MTADSGSRDDRAGLLDWTVSQDVWPNGLHPLVDVVTELGMEYGLWFAPEMVNPDSDVARAPNRSSPSCGNRARSTRPNARCCLASTRSGSTSPTRPSPRTAWWPTTGRGAIYQLAGIGRSEAVSVGRFAASGPEPSPALSGHARASRGATRHATIALAAPGERPASEPHHRLFGWTERGCRCNSF